MKRAARGSGALAFVLVAAMSAIACGDDPTFAWNPSGDGGAAGDDAGGRDAGPGGAPGGGDAGRGGASAGEAGAPPSAGEGGDAGAGGAAGEGGASAPGGSAGRAGQGGEAGEGGATTRGGSAGESGAVGAGGRPPIGAGGEAGSGSSAMVCDALEAPEHGSVDDGGAVYGAVAEYSCERGYRLELSGLRVCRANGTWSGTPPICDRLTCNPISFQGGMVLYIPADRGCDAEARFTCNTGTLSDTAPRFCTCDSGAWEPAPPTCE